MWKKNPFGLEAVVRTGLKAMYLKRKLSGSMRCDWKGKKKSRFVRFEMRGSVSQGLEKFSIDLAKDLADHTLLNKTVKRT